MELTITVEPARARERAAAFRLVFQHVPAGERDARVANALNLVEQGELDPAGVVVARGGRELLGALVCLPVPGASALVWPPQVVEVPGQPLIEDRLVRSACDWLRVRGAKMAQTLLPPEEAYLAAPLTRNGFAHITDLWYMRHTLDEAPVDGDDLSYVSYADGDPARFHETLLRTYEGTRDCPEVNGVRDLQEIIRGHQSQGIYKPERWWLARHRGVPAGVLLLAEMPEWNHWDLSYVGVVPQLRGRGVGRKLARKAIAEARRGGARQLTLAVDDRNQPAWNLYVGLDFRPYDQRHVYLAIWRRAFDPR